jgi:O-antigen/teichoic acid export membrane protein
VAGLVALPILVDALGSGRFGALVVVVSLAPWLTLVDGALSPATRLLVGELDPVSNGGVPRALLRNARSLAIRFAAGNACVLALGLLVLPLLALFGSPDGIDRRDLVAAILAFAIPILLSGSGWVYLGALEGIGRTTVAAVLTGLGPIVALPVTLVASELGAGLVVLCGIQGASVALPRAAAWVYWHLRPSSLEGVSDVRLSGALVGRLVFLSAAVLVQLGLDPLIVASALGSEAAGSYGVASRVITGALIPLGVITPLLAANMAAARGRGWSPARTQELRLLLGQFLTGGIVAGALVALAGPPLAHVLGAGEVEAPRSLYVAGGLFVVATCASTPLYLAFSGPTGLRMSVWLNLVLTVVNVTASLALVRTVGTAGPVWASAGCAAAAASFWLFVWGFRHELLAERHLRPSAP